MNNNFNLDSPRKIKYKNILIKTPIYIIILMFIFSVLLFYGGLFYGNVFYAHFWLSEKKENINKDGSRVVDLKRRELVALSDVYLKILLDARIKSSFENMEGGTPIIPAWSLKEVPNEIKEKMFLQMKFWLFEKSKIDKTKPYMQLIEQLVYLDAEQKKHASFSSIKFTDNLSRDTYKSDAVLTLLIKGKPVVLSQNNKNRNNKSNLNNNTVNNTINRAIGREGVICLVKISPLTTAGIIHQEFKEVMKSSLPYTFEAELNEIVANFVVRHEYTHCSLRELNIANIKHITGTVMLNNKYQNIFFNKPFNKPFNKSFNLLPWENKVNSANSALTQISESYADSVSLLSLRAKGWINNQTIRDMAKYRHKGEISHDSFILLNILADKLDSGEIILPTAASTQEISKIVYPVWKEYSKMLLGASGAKYKKNIKKI